MVDSIHRELQAAEAFDRAALEARRRAGLALVQLRESDPEHWLDLAELDARTATTLIELATGGKEARRPGEYDRRPP